MIPILQSVQNRFNFLPARALKHIAKITDITPARITSVSTFYSQFRHEAVGKHIVKVCVGTACHVKGAMQVYDAFRRHLNLNENQHTDKDKLFTVEKVACLGCCTLAPVVQIDNLTYGHVQRDNISEVLSDFIEQEKKELAQDTKQKKDNSGIQKGEIRLGLGSCCIASGSDEVKDELEKSLQKTDINVEVKHVGCVGVCNQVPLLEIVKSGEAPAYYPKVKPEDVKKIIRKHFKPDSLLSQLKNVVNNFFENFHKGQVPQTITRYSSEQRDTPVSEFLDRQIHIATQFRGEIKPTDIKDYLKRGGFMGARESLKNLSNTKIIEQIAQSGLRGRGGAGFPTGKKWEMVHKSASQKKYILCNGDEGDPGAFMDRMLLESYPFRVIEGMIIASFAIGAKEGFLYIRAEYPLAVERIKHAISLCEEEGILGNNILGSKHSLKLKVVEGAGAFICGEETALIASIEGKRGFPRLRPPYPAQKGLWGYPTLINNAETYSMVPWIMRKGAKVFSKIGTEKSKGTKVFALAGKIARGGLIEVPMGITIHEIIENIGGGIANGKQFKAVQIGGPSGGCVPANLSHTPVDFESLTDVGAMMGSGGLVVLDEDDCMVDIARYFLSFTQNQSCGKCTFCRIGTRRMLDILDRLCTGKAKKGDLEQLEKLAHSTKSGSLCGLGKTAPNPVLSTLHYFRDEYEAHLEGHCPAKSCTDLITYSITDECIGCVKCSQKCPTDAIEPKPYEMHVIENDKCVKCDICRQVCPVDAVIVHGYVK